MSMLYRKRPAPAVNRKDAAHYCEQGPLDVGDAWYVDLSPARGGGGTIATIENRLQDVRDATFHQILFLSHRGAGKTTELRKLQKSLTTTHTTVYIETDQELHQSQIQTEAMLLLVAMKVEETMRTSGLPLNQQLLHDVMKWFADVVRETEWGKTLDTEGEAGAETEADLLSFAKFSAKVKALFRYESKHREKVTEAIRKFQSSLVENVNKLLDAANVLLKRSNCGRLLIIFDNLDRYAPAVMDTVIVTNCGMFKDLRADILPTPPVSLYYLPVSGPLSHSYGTCEFMDAVALRGRDEPREITSGPGLELLRRAVAKRIDIKAVFEDPRDVDDLILVTGGAVRELFEMISLAAWRSADDVKITHVAVQAAKKKRLSELRDMVYINNYENVLAEVAAKKRVVHHESMPRVLHERLVLKYNSDGWYDVFPLLWNDPFLQKHFQKFSSGIL